ncbi:hypothetical protein [Polaromonas hydrogenivorans]|uniref:hypothetical protein n=1 Tax=Polaromonas hydrogenivorans TaxID=335476 RepID=UPI0039F03AF8
MAWATKLVKPEVIVNIVPSHFGGGGLSGQKQQALRQEQQRETANDGRHRAGIEHPEKQRAHRRS